MFAKLAVLPIFFAAVSAGYLGAPLATSVLATPVVKSYGGLGYGAGYGYGGYGAGYGGYGAGYGGYGAGYGYGHGYPLATSYANTYKVSKSIPVIKTVATPVIAPAVIKAPIAYGAHDLGYSSLGYGGYGHGLGYSGLGYGGYGHGLGYSGLGYGYGVGHGLGNDYGYGLYH